MENVSVDWVEYGVVSIGAWSNDNLIVLLVRVTCFGVNGIEAGFFGSLLKKVVLRHLRELEELSPDELLQLRYEKFRKMGSFVEGKVGLSEENEN